MALVSKPLLLQIVAQLRKAPFPVAWSLLHRAFVARLLRPISDLFRHLFSCLFQSTDLLPSILSGKWSLLVDFCWKCCGFSTCELDGGRLGATFRNVIAVFENFHQVVSPIRFDLHFLKAPAERNEGRLLRFSSLFTPICQRGWHPRASN